jgi:phosphate transport system substrate-binding protein
LKALRSSRREHLAGLLGLAAGQAAANGRTDTGELQTYRAHTPVRGTLRLWGHGSFKRDFMGRLVKRWLMEFRLHHPAVDLDYRMYGTASAVGALYSGVGNLALLGEELAPDAARAFQRARGYGPTVVPFATGSLDANFFDYAHMIFVHRDNPLQQLSLTELDAIFGAEHRRGRRNIRRWGELGLEGDWRQRRIQPYGWKVDEDFALFFRERVLVDSHRWNTGLREYVHVMRSDGSQYDHGQQILDALAQDRDGIAISNIRYQVPQVRPLALAWSTGGRYVTASRETLIDQSYPLVRILPAIIDRAPGLPVEPVVREFLRYMLSREGQRALVETSSYLPISPALAANELRKLR